MQAGGSAGVSRALAEFVGACRWEDIPGAVRREAHRALLNYFAVALAGAADPTLDIAVQVYGRFAAGRQASLVGRAERTDVLNAAALNAMAANVYDYDDTHSPTIIHPTAPVAAPLFALAQARPMRGDELLLALVLGIEAECRIGLAVSPGHYARGWHITSTCGVFGSAMAAGKRLGLSATALVWALGCASAQAGGLVETLGTMSKSVGVGNAARNGLLAALLAQQGFAGPDAPLEGPRGFLSVMGEPPQPDAITRDLGLDWQLLRNTYKPSPAPRPARSPASTMHRSAAWRPSRAGSPPPAPAACLQARRPKAAGPATRARHPRGASTAAHRAMSVAPARRPRNIRRRRGTRPWRPDRAAWARPPPHR